MAMARDIGSQMILAEWLFVETVADVRHRSQNPGDRSRYDLLGIAPLPRKLLLERASLVDIVSSEQGGPRSSSSSGSGRGGLPPSMQEPKRHHTPSSSAVQSSSAGRMTHQFGLSGSSLPRASAWSKAGI